MLSSLHILAFAWLTAAAPLEANKVQAKAEATRATTAFKLGRFAEALEGYEHAYELFQAPGLLFNIGQCHRQLGHHERAVFFFTGYLRDNPEAPNRELVERLLEEEKAAVKQEQARPSSAPATAIIAAPASAPTGVSPVAPMQSSATVASEPAWQRWWFWVAIGAGAAVVAGGITAGVLLSQPGTEPRGTLGTLDRRQ